MKRLLSIVAVAALCAPAFVNAQQKNSTEAVVHAANDFLATLSTEQKQKVMYAFDDATQRARWSNSPTGFVARGGISLKQMSAPQQHAAMKLMGTVRSWRLTPMDEIVELGVSTCSSLSKYLQVLGKGANE